MKKQILYFFVLLLFAGACLPEKSEPDPSEQIILLVSIDGFRHDYREFGNTPTLDKLVTDGVVANGLTTVFPSKTFPNHYTQVTGLYPENHGIVSNFMYDSTIGDFFQIGASSTSAKDGRWYGGEPIWVTAKKNAIQSACYFWPGSEAEIGGYRPDHYEVYSDTTSHLTRVNGVLDWLNMPEETRPRFITLYFSVVDSEGHWKGPKPAELRDEIEDVDNALAILVQGIKNQGKENLVNLMVVSDHGMAQMSRDSIIFLDDYINTADARILNYSPVLDMVPNDGKMDTLYNALKDAHPKLTIYKKDEIPADLHFKNNRRIMPIIGYAANGWSITTHPYFDASQTRFTGGAHGYHPDHRDMDGIFIAKGPAFKNGYTGSSFSNVDLYELMCHLLAIDPAPNDGSLNATTEYLND